MDLRENENGDLAQKMEALLAEAETMLRETDNFYHELGLEKEAAERYLNSGKVPPLEREKILRELAIWEEEIQRENEQAAETFRQQRAPARVRPKIPRLRI